jgi:hypothetical protein
MRALSAIIMTTIMSALMTTSVSSVTYPRTPRTGAELLADMGGPGKAKIMDYAMFGALVEVRWRDNLPYGMWAKLSDGRCDRTFYADMEGMVTEISDEACPTRQKSVIERFCNWLLGNPSYYPVRGQ